ncbi:ABC transporter permease [Halorarum salinum]|uniref:ABC transporter permease n=1 Tax=Halorarum salinum TaxID=2743089 RepID=A0A7D5QCB7_9EURY|nr:ABC transporter permease [Halobaculum salinum]QLG61421.1 ABC transporter permease [Halobaculum salinum]
MSAGWYVVRRLLWAVVVTYLILSVTFAFIVLTPNAQVAELQFQTAASGGDPGEAEQAFERARGREGSLVRQYLTYMGNLLTLNWGWSDTRSQPVTEAILEAYPYSLMYAAPAVILSTVLGLAIGLYSATHRYTAGDYLATLFAFFGLSIPNFWLGIVLLLVFGVVLGWVPVVFDPDVPAFSVRNAAQLALPVLVLATSSVAGIMRYTRAEALEYVRAEFVKMARAKGASEWRVLTRHVFRPALVPLVTILVGDLLGIFLAFSLLVEVVFGIPGLGRLSYQALLNGDTALVLGTTLVPVFLAVVGNLLQDVAYSVLDPRIELGGRE